jgi:hypothetical protein
MNAKDVPFTIVNGLTAAVATWLTQLSGAMPTFVVVPAGTDYMPDWYKTLTGGEIQ